MAADLVPVGSMDPLAGVAARTALTFMFWFSGVSKLLDFRGTVEEMKFFRLSPPAPVAVAVIVVQLAGSALVITGLHAWLGCVALAIFTLLTIPVAHDFWNHEGEAALVKRHFAVEHLSMVASLVLVALTVSVS